MNWKVWTCFAAAALFSGALHAQMEADETEETVTYLMELLDADGDGKISKAEVKKVADADAEGATEAEKLENWGNYLLEFLAEDADDDGFVTRDELTKFLKNLDAGKKSKLSAKDWETYTQEYLDPSFAAELKKYDKDNDSAISRKEAEAIEDFPEEAFDQLDADKDGKITAAEYRQFLRTAMAESYEIEEAKPDTGKQEVPTKVKEHFAKIDADGDGFISQAEMKKALGDGQENKAHWWGVYIAFLSMDADDDLKVDIHEFYTFGKDENEGKAHTFYPKDKTEALNEIWLDLDADKDGKVARAEFLKLFPEGGEEFDSWDANANGELTKDEAWDALKPQFEKNFKFPDKDKDADTSNAGGDNSGGEINKEAFALYTKVGRSWMTRTTANYGGFEVVSYTRTEVLEVGDDYAKIKVTSLDKDKKEMAPGMETRISFRVASGTGGTAPEVKTEDETITVEAGEYECVKTTVDTAGMKTSSWTARKFPGLLVKSTSEGAGGKSSTELVEFND
jgi:Ca2+-binding EF-hand superfamily protein